MNQGNQKTIFIERSVNRNLMTAPRNFSVIPMTGDPVVNNLQMNPISLDEFKTGVDRPFWKIFS